MTTTLTPQRQQIIINAMQDMLYLLKRDKVKIKPRMFERIRDGWDAAKLPGMPSITGTQAENGVIAMPLTESYQPRAFSQVEQFSAAADLKQWRAGK